MMLRDVNPVFRLGVIVMSLCNAAACSSASLQADTSPASFYGNVSGHPFVVASAIYNFHGSPAIGASFALSTEPNLCDRLTPGATYSPNPSETLMVGNIADGLDSGTNLFSGVYEVQVDEGPNEPNRIAIAGVVGEYGPVLDANGVLTVPGAGPDDSNSVINDSDPPGSQFILEGSIDMLGSPQAGTGILQTELGLSYPGNGATSSADFTGLVQLNLCPGID